jgi:hypothetical protein
MQNGRTILDYPDVDSFFEDVERGMKDNETPGFNFHRLSDPYNGRGYSFHFVTKKKVSYGFEIALGFTDSLFKLDFDVTAPFDTRVWNTRGVEDSHQLYPLRQIGFKVAALFTQFSVAFNRQ